MPRLSLILIETLVVFGAGTYAGWKLHPQPAVSTPAVEKVAEGKTQIVYKDRVVTQTVTTKPDGTKTESTRTEDKANTEEKTQTASTPVTPAAQPHQSEYSLGVNYSSPYDKLLHPTTDNVGITAGKRLTDDLWIEGGVSREQVTIGVRVEF